MGDKGVCKTWSVDLLMKTFLGLKPNDKIDPGGQNPTIKRYAGYITQPTFIEDNSSSNKV